MEPTLAEIRIFAGNFAPRSWAFCQGQLLPINQNQALYSLLGTTYGGDGRTNFALPDLRGRTAIHAGNGSGLSDRRLGSQGGTETNTLSVNQIPEHTHSATARVNTTIADLTSPENAYLAPIAGRVNSSPPAVAQMATYATTRDGKMNDAAVVIGNTGGNQSMNNMQPWLALNYIIALQGLFPSRN
ncbi:MAG: tail fiber protein [Bacteroidota bacterium]